MAFNEFSFCVSLLTGIARFLDIGAFIETLGLGAVSLRLLHSLCLVESIPHINRRMVTKRTLRYHQNRRGVCIHPGPIKQVFTSGTILNWIERQAIGKAEKRNTPGALLTGVSVSVVAGAGFEPAAFRL